LRDPLMLASSDGASLTEAKIVARAERNSSESESTLMADAAMSLSSEQGSTAADDASASGEEHQVGVGSLPIEHANVGGVVDEEIADDDLEDDDDVCLLLERMPHNYMTATIPAERAAHAALLARLVQYQSDCELSWRHVPARGRMTTELYLAFVDRPGSLSAITACLAACSINILRVGAFSTTDGIAVDTLECSHFDGDAAGRLLLRMRHERDADDLAPYDSASASPRLPRSPNISTQASAHGADAWSRQQEWKPPRASARGTAAAATTFQDLLRNLAGH